MELLEPLLTPLVLLFGAVAAAIGVPIALSDPSRRLRRIGLLAGGVLIALVVHGELRSAPVVRAGLLAASGVLGALLFALSLRRYLLRRAILAERPRSPDEWVPGDGRRLWTGTLQAASPLRDDDGNACLYLRVEIDRWDAGRWRRIAAQESCAERVELVGRSRRMAVRVPRAVLRRAAREMRPYRASRDGWRLDPDPDPAALYRTRTVGVLDHTSVQVLARAERREAVGLVLQGAAEAGFQLDREPPLPLGKQAGLLAAGALLCALMGLWGAWG